MVHAVEELGWLEGNSSAGVRQLLSYAPDKVRAEVAALAKIVLQAPELVEGKLQQILDLTRAGHRHFRQSHLRPLA